ncbi:hypothetical protein bcgnr5369_01400 [Bacillus cereus]
MVNCDSTDKKDKNDIYVNIPIALLDYKKVIQCAHVRGSVQHCPGGLGLNSVGPYHLEFKF